MNMHHKFGGLRHASKALAPVGLEFKFSTEKPGQITGYGAIFNTVDGGFDIIAPGAFDRTLAEWKAKGKLPKMLEAHDIDEPIGTWTDISVDERGLRCTGELLMSISDGAEMYEKVKAGLIDGLSIGYKTISRSYNDATGVRTLLDLDLYEVSLVTFPMHDDALIDGVKGMKSPQVALLEAIESAKSISDVERAVRDAFDFSRKEAATFMARMKAATQRDAGGADEMAALKKRIAALNS